MFAPASNPILKSPEKIKASAYYDAVNFARLINIPGFYSWGYNDEVCPPTTSYAAYNSIHAPKEKFITKESGHWLTPEQAINLNGWLLKKLSITR
jgi:cephalosporin-C deacetylase-like acetyl esterase